VCRSRDDNTARLVTLADYVEKEKSLERKAEDGRVAICATVAALATNYIDCVILTIGHYLSIIRRMYMYYYLVR